MFGRSSGATYTIAVGCPDPEPQFLRGADFNGDGRTDILADGMIYVQNADGTFAPGVLFLPGFGPAESDVNADGAADLVTLADGQVNIAYGGSALTFATVQTIPHTGFRPGFQSGYLAELTGDGILDLVTGDTVYTGVNAVAPAAAGALPVTVSVAAGAVQRFTFNFTDGDGATDIVSISLGGGCFFTINPITRQVDGASTGWLFNHGCAVDAGSVAVSPVGQSLSVSVDLSIQKTGTFQLEAVATDAIGLQSAPSMSSVTVNQTNTPPSIVSVNSPSGRTAVFNLSFSDPNGLGDILFTDLLINDALQLANACFLSIRWDFATVALVNDAGTSASVQSIRPMSPMLANSQCSVDPTTITRQFVSPTQVTVSIPVTFSNQWTTPKKLFVRAIDNAGASTELQERGTWTPSSTSTGPSVVDLQPRTGAGNSATLTAQWRHPNGAAGHYLGYILVLPTPNVVQFTAQGTCLIEYNRISNGIRLIDNAGTGWLGPVSGVPIGPGAMTLENNQCSIDVSKVVAAVSGEIMTVTAPVQFKNSMGVVLGTFIQAQDVTGKWTGMTQFGNWVIPTGTPQAAGPFVVNMTPAAGSGSSMLVTMTYGHKSGNTKTDVDLVHLRFASSLTLDDYCHVLYSPGANAINLINDAGTAFAGSWVAFGAPDVTSVENLRCKVERTGLTQNPATGPQMTTSFTLNFKPAFAGPKNTYMNVFDHQGRTTHWVQVGTWTPMP
jgi:hypothetical protein